MINNKGEEKMPIGEKFDELKEAIELIENHPLAKKNVEVKIAYLDGLALLMNEDSEIHDKEVKFLKLMIRSLGINEACIDDLIEFTKKPDNERIKKLLTFNII